MPAVADREPRVLGFDTYLDEAGQRYTTVQVHPDAESMEYHMIVMAEEIGAAFEYVESDGVEVYGEPVRLQSSIGVRGSVGGFIPDCILA